MGPLSLFSCLHTLSTTVITFGALPDNAPDSALYKQPSCKTLTYPVFFLDQKATFTSTGFPCWVNCVFDLCVNVAPRGLR